MQITTNRFTISQLFSSPNEQFVIPSYQRRYAWKEAQVGALFDDIDLLKDNDGHLFGMIILHTSMHVGGLNKPELVDGQQRLTTLTILLRAIETRYAQLGKKDKAEEVHRLLIAKTFDDKTYDKLLLGDLDHDDYRKVMTQKNLDTIGNANIKDAYTNCLSWLQDYDIEGVNKFYYKLTNVAVIIRLDVSHAQDAYKLFETINNRGLRLTATDVIKNFLLGHAAKMDDNQTLDHVRELWSKVITDLDGIDTDDFLRQYACTLLGRKLSGNMLIGEFKKYYMKHVLRTELLGEYEHYAQEEYVEGEDEELPDDPFEDETEEEALNNGKQTIQEFLTDIRNASSIYKQLHQASFKDAKVNRHMRNLHRILSKPTYIFLMHYMQQGRDSKEVYEVLRLLEIFMLRRHICGMRTSEHDEIFSKLLRTLDEDDIIQAIKDHLQDYYPEDSLFQDRLPTYEFKGILIERAKYILEQIEYDATGSTGEFLVGSSTEVHLEHIVPQVINTKKSKKEFGDWETYLGKNAKTRHKRLVNYIGNMTLLGAPLNIKASNNPFRRKRDSYAKSMISLTNELAKMPEFKFSHLEKRGEDLTEKALKIWSIEYPELEIEETE